MATWSNHSENSATWSNDKESSDAGGFIIGNPIGLLLVLTYATTQAVTWSNISENAASWNNIAES